MIPDGKALLAHLVEPRLLLHQLLYFRHHIFDAPQSPLIKILVGAIITGVIAASARQDGQEGLFLQSRKVRILRAYLSQWIYQVSEDPSQEIHGVGRSIIVAHKGFFLEP